MKRSHSEIELVDELCDLFSKSNVYNEEDEYSFLLEGANCKEYDEKIIKIAELRYRRYLDHIYFEPKLKYIQKLIYKFLNNKSFLLMKHIDSCILNYLHTN